MVEKQHNLSTPEEVANAFCEAWVKREWTKMQDYLQLTWKEGKEDLIQELKDKLEARPLLSFAIVPDETRKIQGPMLPDETMVDVVIDGVMQGVRKEEGYKLLIRVACETSPYQPAVGGQWGVNPASVRTAF